VTDGEESEIFKTAKPGLDAARIKDRAIELGFSLCGVAAAESFPELEILPQWLARGYAGEMEYLHKSAEARADIRRFLPTAQSVIVTATLYHAEEPPRRAPAPDTVTVARYARGRDYHQVLAERLEALVAWMRAEHQAAFDAAIFVDKHHVQERAYAARAGLGWIGKNTCLISPSIGSWLLLAGVATSLPLAADTPTADQCGACTLCLDACPTGALVEPRVLDATKCIAYLTIELAGPVPEEQRTAIGRHVFGCDICQDVCPWNLGAPVTGDEAWRPRGAGARASELWQRTDQDLHGFVRGSAMTYVPLSRLRRNLAMVMGNTGAAGTALDRPGHGVRNAARSAQTAVVEGAVAWAKSRMGGV
jgi:epoxyqueuosine reductase